MRRSRSGAGVRTFLWLLCALLLLASRETAAQTLSSSTYASGFTTPIAFVQDPTNSAVQFVVEQGGRIRTVISGVVQPTDFLDLSAVIASGGEQGLLGMAFPPDAPSTGRFFVNFTNPAGNTVVARFKRSGNPLVASAASRFDLRWGGPTGPSFISQPFGNHNGGNLAFGPDGYLYIGMGDGGSGNDPSHRAQNPSELLGKMLRIDVSVADSDPQGYRVPPDNPFLDGQPVAALPEIWSFGLRNPWRYSFDDPALGGSGALIIGDVGQGSFEEVSYEPPGRGGRNYGWRNREGAHDNVTSLPPAYLPLIEPIHEYGRNVGQSITGGRVYRGRLLGTPFVGRYFFADFVSARVFSMALTINPSTGEATATNLVEHTAQLAPLSNVSSFGVDAAGELYIVDYSNGRIRRVSATPAGPVITLQPSDREADDQILQFSVAATGTPVPDYQWRISLDGVNFSNLADGQFVSGSNSSTLTMVPSPAQIGARLVCVVSNSAGSVTSGVARILPPPPVRLSRASLRFGGTKLGTGGPLVAVTPAQNVRVSVLPSSAWTASADQPWIQITNGSGTQTGTFTVAIVNPGNVLGASQNVSANITVSVPGLSTSLILPVSLAIQLVTTSSVAPFGSFDTPSNGATAVSGAIPVTGWALDDIGVATVQIWRNCVEAVDRLAGACTQSEPGGAANFVFVGDATFLAGARPDVETLNPGSPQAYRAGWGLLVSTNAFPHATTPVAPQGGQGTFTLTAYAVDLENHFTFLGTKTITIDNDSALIPFGVLDTPAQGGTITTPVFASFGWAFTQNPKCILTNLTASYRVYIDGFPMTLTPGTNWFPGLNRLDIAAAYPGRCNTTDALAAFYINAQLLPNGVHTTGWDVIDNQGKVAGIGSRFFNVLLGSSLSGGSGGVVGSGTDVGSGFSRIAGSSNSLAIRLKPDPTVRVQSGSASAPFEAASPDSLGRYHVRFPAGGRLALDLGGPVDAGYQVVGDQLRALPAGSSLDASSGLFAWMPPVPFLGPFHLVFVSGNERVDVTATITDPTAAGTIAMHIDTPAVGRSFSSASEPELKFRPTSDAADPTVTGSFVVAGWALDPLAVTGSGVDTLHVWAYRRDGIALPQFLGAAAVGGLRPDVATVHGAQFERSGFTLTSDPLPPGTYDILVYPHRATGAFDEATSIRIRVQ